MPFRRSGVYNHTGPQEEPTAYERVQVKWLIEGLSEAEESTATWVLRTRKQFTLDMRVLKAYIPYNLGYNNHISPAAIGYVYAGTPAAGLFADKGQVPEIMSLDPPDEAAMAGTFPARRDEIIEDRLWAETTAVLDQRDMSIKNCIETWRKVPTLRVNNAAVRECVVLMAAEDQPSVRGVVIRLGQFCQGVLYTGDQLSAERWRWLPPPGMSNARGAWQHQFRVGVYCLPCFFTFLASGYTVGDSVTHQGIRWIVTEITLW